MPKYSFRKKQGKIKGALLMAIAALVIVLAALIIAVTAYAGGLRPVSNSQQTEIYTVKTGSSVSEVAESLKSEGLIRSSWAMRVYMELHAKSGKLQAGSFALSPSQGTRQIVATLTEGRTASRLVTILPGRRIDQVRADLINDGFAPAEVDTALNPATYAGMPVLQFAPAGVTTLEGLLWPDSFQKDADTTAQDIIRQSLVAMGQHLTPEVQAGYTAQGLTVYQGLILSSIVVQEVNKPEDQAQAAQVFLARIRKGMSLGSDATARYGAITAGLSPRVDYDSAYNTLMHPGLPPTPISSLSSSSIQAVVHPANTNWLYFVSGDDGTTYFSNTLDEHNALVQQHCHKNCGG